MSATATTTSRARRDLYRKYEDLLEVNPALTRSIVSYQANRNRPYYRWFKYKEGFSAALVEHVLDRFPSQRGRLLDPFAGSGAALRVAQRSGMDAAGIELLPVGFRIVQTWLAAERACKEELSSFIDSAIRRVWAKENRTKAPFPHLRITDGAFPEETEKAISQYRCYIANAKATADVRLILDAAALGALEEVSFTRKDGQYLRWDHRAPRKLRGKKFNKGEIHSFPEAVSRRLRMMKEDILSNELFDNGRKQSCGTVDLTLGSCLDRLPDIEDESVDLVVTSPPYCNRYDYTRTYALELAYLGVDEEELKRLRQELLSCTVENASKQNRLRDAYLSSGNHALFEDALSTFDNNEALNEVMDVLDAKGRSRALNNPNVPRMVRNYFLEMAIVVFELARVVKSGRRVVLVNDNVQYGGEEIPVDLILSEFAVNAGFDIETIWVLQRGKGNSSQQMGAHGRNELRKCSYVWRRQ